VARVVLALDGDRAGQEATRKAARLLMAAGVATRVAALPPGEDPDSLGGRPDGAVQLQGLLQRAPSVVEYLVDEAAARLEHDGTIPARAAALDELAPLLREVQNPIERDLYTSRIASRLGVSLPMVQRAVRLGASGTNRTAASSPSTSTRAAPAPVGQRGDATGNRPPESVAARSATPPPKEEVWVVSLLAAVPRLIPKALELKVLDLLVSAPCRETFRQLVQLAQTAPEQVRVDALRDLPPALVATLSHAVMDRAFESMDEPERALLEAVGSLRRNGSLQDELNAARNALQAAQDAGDEAKARELVLEIHRLNEQRSRLQCSRAATATT
jgi:DNA primase